MIWGLQVEELPEHLDRIAPFLVNFAERSHERATAVELYEKIAAKDMQVWVVDDFKAVCLTSVHPSHVEINCCGGEDREEWADDLEFEIARWALYLGKKRVIMVTRPGWSKWAKTKGYKLAHVEMVREL